ncbi:DUF2322 family protein [Acidihalobacter ferrooxydans]|uniref:DUF2322 domain-containing protein n=1 Tax=Acidihalobacter ferrooxydans TaxID=1765967 RepID=A0A1P8UFT0_9GAMM|nr:DUF2322 family protein [Acidihalobacter ferrooxydans]APZ42712.1 hypothetical protein BW247_06050 [Acidihalobacter ferrooxydans]
MPSFAENLAKLPSVTDIQALELYGDGYEADVVIENAPGSQGSLAVYYHVAVQHGGITPKAAQEALELFAEKATEARANPGAHPNIDRLFQIIEQDLFYSVKAVPNAS